MAYEQILNGAATRLALYYKGGIKPGRIAIDLAIVDARPADASAADSLLALEARNGGVPLVLSRSLARIPANALIGRRYRRLVDASV